MGVLTHGETLQNRYVIERTLGHGGMGAVYLATHIELGRPVAIKELHGGPNGFPPEAIRQFRTEARFLHDLRHPNLPQIYDFLEASGAYYLVMEYIAGRTLDEVLLVEGAPTEARVLAWARQLCDVLQYLHTRRPPVIFRDLKPSNVMLTGQEQIKLIDFGIAKFHDFDAGLQTGTYLRGSLSPGFAAPEQYGGGTDVRSDIYSLGATLYCLLTSEIPPESVDVATGRTPHVSVRRARPDVSERTSQVIEAMMKVDRSQRPSTARAVAEALDFEARDPSQDETGPAPVPSNAPAPPSLPTVRSLRDRREGPSEPPPRPAGTGEGAGAARRTEPGALPPAPSGFQRRSPAPPTSRDSDSALFGRRPEATARPDGPARPEVATRPPSRSQPTSLHATPWDPEPPGELGLAVRDRDDAAPSARLARRSPREAAAIVEIPASEIDLPRHRTFPARTLVRVLVAALLLAGVLSAFPAIRSRLAGPDPALAVLDVSTDPEGASVWVDDVDKGVAPLRLSSLAPGKHTVRIEHPSCETIRQGIDLGPGETQKLRVALHERLASPAAVSPIPAGPAASPKAPPTPRPVVARATRAPAARPAPARTVEVPSTTARPVDVPATTAAPVPVAAPHPPAPARTVVVVQPPPVPQPPPDGPSGPEGAPGPPTQMLITPGTGVGQLSLGSSLDAVLTPMDRPIPFEGGTAHVIRRFGIAVVSDGSRVGAIVVAPFLPALMQRLHYATTGGIELGSPEREVTREFGPPPSDRLRGNHVEWDYPSRGIAFHMVGGYVRTIVVHAAR